MTLDELKTAIETEMQLDPGLISDSERERFINRAIEDLSRIPLWEKETSVDVTANTIEVDLPQDFNNIIEVFWDGLPLRPVKRRRSPDQVHGKPIGFILKPNKIELYPVPSSDGKLFYVYQYKGLPLTNPSDEPNFHEDVGNLIIDYATAQAHRKNGNAFMYQQYMLSYQSERGILIDKLTREVNSRVRTSYHDELTNDPLTPFDYL